jgi:hypothetical protein
MPDRQQNYYIQDLLNLLTNRVYRRRQQSRVPGPDGNRVIEDVVDDTGIGPNNETDINVTGDEYILDCGHPAKSNLGGRCHYCDSLVCRACIGLCSSCGHSICPQDTVSANFDGQLKPYCRSCTEEIAHHLRLCKLGTTILSFFISREGKA